MPPRRLVLLAPVLVAAFEGCGETPPRLGATPGEAQHHVGEALGALGSCFGPSERDAALEELRPKLLRAALVPSRVFDDESAWTHRDGETRGLGFRGFRAEGLYRAGVTATPPPPTRAADYQGWLTLRRLGPGEFEWSSAEQIGLGPLPVDGFFDLMSQALRAAEASEETDVRPELRRLLPRTAEALGRGLALEALRLEHDATGSTAVFAAARLDLESLAPGFPRYASFLGRYVLPIRLRFEMDDGRWRGPLVPGGARRSLLAPHADPGRSPGSSRGPPAASPGTAAASRRPDESGGRLPLRDARPRGGRPSRRPARREEVRGGVRPRAALGHPLSGEAAPPQLPAPPVRRRRRLPGLRPPRERQRDDAGQPGLPHRGQGELAGALDGRPAPARPWPASAKGPRRKRTASTPRPSRRCARTSSGSSEAAEERSEVRARLTGLRRGPETGG